MPDIHLNTTGSNTVPYDTWANAATTLAAAVTQMVPGDNLFIDKAFTTAAAGINVTFPGTPANPNCVYSGTPATTNGLSDISAGAKLVSNTTLLSIHGSANFFHIEVEGTSGSSTPGSIGAINANIQTWEDCYFNRMGTGASSSLTFGGSSSGTSTKTTLIRPRFRFGAAAHTIRPHGRVEMFEVSFVSGSNPATVFNPASGGRGVYLDVYGIDFNNLGTTFTITGYGADQQGYCRFSDIKLPSGWTGLFSGATPIGGAAHDFYAVAGTDTRYCFWLTRHEGNVYEDATVHLTGSITDGGNISDQFATSANVAFPGALKGRWYSVEVSSGLGFNKTATIECAMDGTSTIPTDAQVWMELEFFGNNGSPLGKFASDRCTPFAFLTNAATTHTASSASWTGLGGTSCKFKLECAFTPEEAGYIRARVCTAMASNSQLHVDPNITVT